MAGLSGLSTPNPRQEPSKQMSSRLLNMKFMQRAAASTPASSNLQTPSTEPVTKRRRIESSASSPSTSTPGTPANVATPSGVAIPTLGSTTGGRNTGFGVQRGGRSIFNRGDGADTEWVLETEQNLQPTSTGQPSSHAAGVKGSRFLQFREGQEAGEEEEDDFDEDDIWDNQPSGRQTYGSFKKKRKAKAATQDDQDLSSASEGDSDSDEDEDDGKKARRGKAAGSRTGRRVPSSQGVDSDEEMRQVRRAIEQKHRNMMGTAPSRGSNGSPGGGGAGQKRRRDEGGYKAKKKARKTI